MNVEVETEGRRRVAMNSTGRVVNKGEMKSEAHRNLESIDILSQLILMKFCNVNIGLDTIHTPN